VAEPWGGGALEPGAGGSSLNLIFFKGKGPPPPPVEEN